VILPTSMDGDGTQAGFDILFTQAISDAVRVPVVASGGAGKLEDFYRSRSERGRCHSPRGVGLSFSDPHHQGR